MRGIINQIHGWTDWTGPDYNPDQMVLDGNIGHIKFRPPHPTYGGNVEPVITIVYFNFSGDTKKLGECDALVCCEHITSGKYNPDATQFLGPYLYVAGGINSEDAYWNYSTLTDYLKETGTEYEEIQSGSSIEIRFKLEDVLEDAYDDYNYDLKYIFWIDANSADLTRIQIE